MEAETETVRVLEQDEILRAKESWTECNSNSKAPLIPDKSKIILPIKGEKNYLITAALPYVNNVPHLGNIIGCVLSADIFSRYCRLIGRNTLYICGTDEYGTATETKAIEEGLTPQQICDKYHKLHDEIYQWFGISFDYFGRTTTPEQTKVGQGIFLRLHENGYLKEMVVQQLFCIPCARFLSDRFVEGTCPNCNYDSARGDQCDKCGRLTNSTELICPRCIVCGSKEVITKNSEQVFLDLPQLLEKTDLEEWLERVSLAWTPTARNIAKAWIKEGLKERCITRDLKWGTPVPLEKFKKKVFYVWFDAPIGYVSMTACYTKDWESWWINPSMDIDYYEFMAKDNVPFHSILFPASQKGTGQPWLSVTHLMAVEYLNYEDGKFSKSRGIGVFGNDAINSGIPADIWRFYLLFIRPEGQDSAFSWEDFMTKNNSELLNNLGNFVNRSLSFIDKFFEGTIPKMDLNEDDYKVAAQINREISEYASSMEACKMKEGLKRILAISKIGNQYFQSQQPWTLNKKPETMDRCKTICGFGAQIVCLISTLIEPFMPETGKQIREQLNYTEYRFELTLKPYLAENHKIGKVGPLFQKLEAVLIEDLRKRYAGVQIVEKSSKEENVVNSPPTTATAEEIATQEALIAQQGEKVRDLKTNKAEKSEIDAAVKSLLDLKAKLAEMQGIDMSKGKPKGGKGKKK